MWSHSNVIKLNDELYFGAALDWNEPNFSEFAFDLLARANGTFEIGRLSSSHVRGRTAIEEKKNNANNE